MRYEQWPELQQHEQQMRDLIAADEAGVDQADGLVAGAGLVVSRGRAARFLEVSQRDTPERDEADEGGHQR